MSAQREDVVSNEPSDPIPAPHPATELDHPPASPAVPVLNIANVLTVVRIGLVPIFVWALFLGDGHSTSGRITAFAIFAVAAITDRVDGQLARKYGLVTDFGKLADPIADKALIGAALVGLSVLGDLSWWVTAIIGARELAITALRFVVVQHRVIPASRGGKLKTLVQSLAIGLYILPLPAVAQPVCAGFMAVAVFLTIVTGIDYVVQALRLGSHRHAHH
ncbi:CDP-diacylglycerol--glycerol-3-phosphate 3-phosphatidyltransferase [Skermania sp. ID1734]|uniref:CDP-diacylglycerol--glycerol-3-phosphate 3-phosphatidyltransferase n=1 Tax=Skermania sp. ID1734 TaxID=2597516 RepID=UPI00117C8E2A|nr:CDP-diacylglycerol--glycerol-3-phosphate 3-phosphatidyltransferase [Skermania sp. ID1734]TSD96080.1 CDP-diacylglycerol--glycerol-3-phosphate 3-phosphatidyltransferase [Skermania sp. ID1734]